MCKQNKELYIKKTSFREIKMIAINSADLSKDVFDALKLIAKISDIPESNEGDLIFLAKRLSDALERNEYKIEQSTLFKLKDIYNNVKYYKYINLCKF